MQTLGRCFRMLVSNKHSSWVSHLEKINGWINLATHDSTGFTPYELHYGEKPPRPLANIIDCPGGDERTQKQIYDKALENLKHKAELRKLENDPAKQYYFKINDKVLVRVVHLSSALNKQIGKFFELCDGPFMISKVIGPNAYLLSHIRSP